MLPITKGIITSASNYPESKQPPRPTTHKPLVALFLSITFKTKKSKSVFELVFPSYFMMLEADYVVYGSLILGWGSPIYL